MCCRISPRSTPAPHTLTDALLRAVAVDAGRVARALDDLPADPALAAPAKMLTRAAELGIRLPSAIVEAGVRRDATRVAALVYLLDRPEEAHGDTHLLATLAARVSSGWETVMLELVVRGDPSSERRDLRPVLAALRGTQAPAGFWRLSGLSRLSPDERTELPVLPGPERSSQRPVQHRGRGTPDGVTRAPGGASIRCRVSPPRWRPPPDAVRKTMRPSCSESVRRPGPGARVEVCIEHGLNRVP